MRHRFPRWAAVIPCALVTMGTVGCETQKDAVAAAKQMAQVSATMTAYYSGLEAMVVANEDALAAQQLLLGVPAVVTTLEKERAELKQREAVADGLTKLSELFGSMAGSTAASDAAIAGGNLETAVSGLTSWTPTTAQTTGLTVVVTSLVNAIRAKDERRAAQLMAPVVSELSKLFDGEQKAYVAVGDEYYQVAASNAKWMVRKNLLDPSALYGSSLKPFGMVARADAATGGDAVQMMLHTKIDDAEKDQMAAEAKATAELSAALHVMADETQALARKRSTRASVPVLTLEGVKAWVADVKTDTGVK